MDLPNTTPPEPIKFSAEEIQKLATIRSAYEQITLALGQLEMQRREFNRTATQLDEKLIALQAEEKTFLDSIVSKYGEGTFDIGTGVFTPKKV